MEVPDASVEEKRHQPHGGPHELPASGAAPSVAAPIVTTADVRSILVDEFAGHADPPAALAAHIGSNRGAVEGWATGRAPVPDDMRDAIIEIRVAADFRRYVAHAEEWREDRDDVAPPLSLLPVLLDEDAHRRLFGPAAGSAAFNMAVSRRVAKRVLAWGGRAEIVMLPVRRYQAWLRERCYTESSVLTAMIFVADQLPIHRPGELPSSLASHDLH